MSLVLIGVMVVSLFAGLLHGLTGFGFGIVAMPLLALVLPYRDSLVLVSILTPLLVFVGCLKNMRHYVWPLGCWLIAGTSVGVPLGIIMVIWIREALLLRGLGALMCGVAINALWPGQTSRSLPHSWSFPVGIVSGCLSGAFNMGGPIAVGYAYAQKWSKQQIVVVLQMVILLTSSLRVVYLWRNDLVTGKSLSFAAWTVLPMFIGQYVGNALFNRIPEVQLKKGVYMLIGVLGLKLLISA